ncbi:unnamed protein product [Lactuca saligna]|uniref:Bifunctional inhibitor/plant lipid transfer protein/seed storage helical domain-containing protein n=1 Tax=Lactuca saligna TaxID=75948 RepID=A0AA36E0B2_LACSI|nr:unnamed protein product [Lactuca saligna]
MARYSLLFAAAGLLLLVTMAEATTKTIFTTTTTFEENPTGKRTEMSCGQQLAEQAMLNHCMMYLDTASGMSMGRGRMSEPTPEQHLELCCMQLTNIDEMCRCEAIEMMMNQQGWTPQQMGKMMGMAKNLPKTCKVEPGMCKMRAAWF